MKLLKRMSAVLMALAVMFSSLSLTAYAEGDPQTVTITLNANGGTFADGTGEMTKPATPGLALPYFETPTCANKVFVGWKLSADGDTTVSVMGNAPEQDATYYAHWLDSVNVTFDPNGGTYTGSNSTTVAVPKGYTSAESMGSIPAWSTYNSLTTGAGFVAPSSEYAFVGWALSADGQNKIESTSEYRFEADTTVYAIWQKAVTVTVYTGDTASLNNNQTIYPSSLGMNIYLQNGTYGSSMYSNAIGTVAADGKSVVFTVPEGAYFTLTDYNPSSGVITESSGRAFLGWGQDATGNVLYTTNAQTQLTQSAELYAIWGDGIKVTLNANGGTFGDGTTKQVKTFADNSQLYNGVLPFPSCSDSSKTFYAWSTTTDESGIVVDISGKTYTLGTEDLELYALYKVSDNTSVILTFVADGKGYFSESGVKKDKVESNFAGPAYINTIVTASSYTSGRGFVPNNGYAFLGWSVNKDATEPDNNGQYTENTTLYPVVVPGYKLTLDPGAATWKTGTSAYQNYVYWYNNYAQKQGMDLFVLNNEFGASNGLYSGQMSNVFAAPENTIFIGWTTVKNDKSTLVKYGDTLQGDTTLYACFDEKATIVLDANGGCFNNSENTKTQTYELPKGSTQYIYGYPSIIGDKAFVGWSTTRDESGLIANTSGGSINVVSAENATYYAIYKDAYAITYNFNGGMYGVGSSATQSSEKVLRGNHLSYNPTLASITKSGKILVGWTDAKPGTAITSDSVVLSNYYNSEDFVAKYVPTKNMTLYALWEDAIEVSIVTGKYGCYKKYGSAPWNYTYIDESVFKIAKGYFYGENVPYIKDEYVGKMTFAGFAKTPDGEVEIEYDSDSQTYLIDEPGTYYAVYKKVENTATPSAEDAFSNDTAPNEVIREAEKNLVPTTAQQAEVKAQKLMNSLRARLEGTVVTTDQVEAAPGSSVMIDSIEEVKNEATINSLQQVVTSVMKSAMAADTTIRDVKLVELNARGSGSVKFLVGKEYAGTVAVVGHYHDGIWTTQQCKVDRNGYITPNFVSFSPIAIMLTTATEEFTNLETTSEPTAVDVASAAPAPSDVNGQGTNAKSPKTGEEAYNYFLLVGMICLAGSVICYMLSRRKEYR